MSTSWKLRRVWLWKSCKHCWERKEIPHQLSQQRWSPLYICLISPHVMGCLMNIIHNPDFQGLPINIHCLFPDQVKGTKCGIRIGIWISSKTPMLNKANKDQGGKEKNWPNCYALRLTTPSFSPRLISAVKGSEASPTHLLQGYDVNVICEFHSRAPGNTIVQSSQVQSTRVDWLQGYHVHAKCPGHTKHSHAPHAGTTAMP